MKVNFSGNCIYKSKLLKSGLELAANNGSLFAAGTSLALSTVVRPVSIFATPKTDKENKKLACAKSIASATVGFGLMVGATLPITRNIEKINKNPKKYLKQSTINALKENSKPLASSKGYQFATQLFKLGIGAVAAVPKALITCALIPPIMYGLLSKKPTSETDNKTYIKQNNIQSCKNNITFTGKPNVGKIAKGISKVLDTKSVQDFANKYKDTNYPMHIAALTDGVATTTFIVQTKNNKKIEEKRKNTLCYNAGISTGLSIASSYVVDKALDKPTEKFIDRFREVNKNSPKLEKYVEGIKIAKPALIMGMIYYGVIPFISTYVAEKLGKNSIDKSKCS